jgi:ribosomal small subunit protein bTHX
MGKGDKKSKRGKIIAGSFGVRRRKKTRKSFVAPSPNETAKTALKTATATATEVPAAKPARTVRSRTASKTVAKPAEKKSEQEAGTVAEKPVKAATKTRKPAAKKEEE